ncbi:MAG: lantibiotic dehydratase [Stackebrandtia sp.]
MWRPISVDTAADARIRIPKTLAEQAARAAGVLWRIAPGDAELSASHERFLHRYGAHRLVPLPEACDPVTGLGYDEPGPASPLQPETKEVLAGLLADALARGEAEVRLDAATVDALDRREPDDHPEASAEIYARVLTGNNNAADFELAVSGMASPAGSTRARFTGLLPARVADVDAGHGPMTAELAFRPLNRSVAALTGPAEAAPWRIPVGTTPREGDLLPNDLAIYSNGHRLTVWSTQHHRPVTPVHHNNLGHHLMPPLAGFLCRVGQHRAVPLSPWTWAGLEHAPFLPRVRCDDAILSSARWSLPEDVRQAADDTTAWDTSLRGWRSSTRPAPPHIVVVDDTDRQLPLDLDRDEDRELLRRYVRRGVRAVSEPPGGADAEAAVVPGPAGNHALEIVVPLTAASQPQPASPPPAPARAPGEGLYVPGGPWLSLAIRAPRPTQDAVLERIAATACDTADLWDRWFWLRYDTNALGPHLRVRFHGVHGDLGGKLLSTVNQVCAHLVADRLSGGFVVEPYDREIERYGGPDAIEAAETVFFRDGELVAALLACEGDPDRRIALAAASAAAITRVVADSDRDALAPYRLERGDRRRAADLRKLARALDDNDPPEPCLWADRETALGAYRELLTPDWRVDCASAVIHMHANRLLGDNRLERIARALAADLLARKSPCP